MQLDILRNSGNIFSGFEFETTNIIFYTYPNSTTEIYWINEKYKHFIMIKFENWNSIK